MNCVEWEEQIALLAGGDLGLSETADVEQHLAGCTRCREFQAGLVATLDTVRNLHKDEIPQAHFQAVRTGVLAEIRRERRVWRRLAWVSGVGIAAALIAGIALKPGPLPAPPKRLAVVIPAAPIAPRVTTSVSTRTAGKTARPTRPSGEPLLVKLQTADPKIVIYWIAD